MTDMMDIMDIVFPHLHIVFHNVPKSISVFGFSIAYYGIIMGISMLLGVALAARQITHFGRKSDEVWDMAVYILIFSVIGARTYYVIFSWDKYKDNLLSIFNTRNGGMAIYGGVIAGFATLFIYCAIKKISSLSMCDACVCGLTLGQVLGRWGNFMNREAFGEYTDNLLAMRLPIEAVRRSDISENIAAHIVEGTNYIQVHPTFLYESLWNLALLILLLWVVRHRKFEGQVCLTYFGGYGLGRFWVEALRTDQLLVPKTGIPVSQVVAVVLILICATGYFFGIRKLKSDATAAAVEESGKTAAEAGLIQKTVTEESSETTAEAVENTEAEQENQ